MRVFRGSRLQRNGYIGKKDWSCAGTEYGALESKESDKAVVSIKGLLSDITQDHVRTRRSASLAFDVPSIGTIRCTQVFRAILGKRIVCLGQAEGDQVIVKLYFDPQRARIHWRRSDEGSRAFLDRFIASPKILFSGYLVKQIGRAHV